MSALDMEILSLLYLGGAKTYCAELTELARLCCTRHDTTVARECTDGRAAQAEIDAYYTEAARLGFEGSGVMWRRYVVGKREIEI
jgi:hypothetical protein